MLTSPDFLFAKNFIISNPIIEDTGSFYIPKSASVIICLVAQVIYIHIFQIIFSNYILKKKTRKSSLTGQKKSSEHNVLLLDGKDMVDTLQTQMKLRSMSWGKPSYN